MPQLNIDGTPFGGVKTVLDVFPSGALAAAPEQTDVDFNASIAT